MVVRVAFIRYRIEGALVGKAVNGITRSYNRYFVDNVASDTEVVKEFVRESEN